MNLIESLGSQLPTLFNYGPADNCIAWGTIALLGVLAVTFGITVAKL